MECNCTKSDASGMSACDKLAAETTITKGWQDAQNRLSIQFDDLLELEKATKIDSIGLSGLNSDTIFFTKDETGANVAQTVEQGLAQQDYIWGKLNAPQEELSKILTQSDQAQQDLRANFQSIWQDREDSIALVMSNNMALVKNNKDIAAFADVFESRYGAKFGSEESSNVSEWKNGASESLEGVYITENEAYMWEKLSALDLNYKFVPFCDGFESDSYQPKRSELEIENCQQQADVLKADLERAKKSERDIIGESDKITYADFLQTDLQATAVKARKFITGIIGTSDAQRKEQEKRLKDISSEFDRYATYQKYGFEREGAAALTSTMAAIAFVAGAALF